MLFKLLIYFLRSQKEACQDFQLHTIELKKFHTNTPLPDLKNALDRWVTFLTKAHEFSKNKVPSELKNKPDFKKAITVLDTLYLVVRLKAKKKSYRI